jgi:hypothetical protein
LTDALLDGHLALTLLARLDESILAVESVEIAEIPPFGAAGALLTLDRALARTAVQTGAN